MCLIFLMKINSLEGIMKKSTKSLLLGTVLIPSAFAITSDFNQVSADSLKEVTAQTLNVRSAASSSSKIIDWVSKGTVVTVIKDGANWDYVEYGNGSRGYVSDAYLKNATSTGTHSVNTGTLTVRSTGSVSGKAIDYISKGTKVTVTTTLSNGWAKVSYNGKTGYVNAKYLTKLTTNTTASTPKTVATTTNTDTSKISYVYANSLTLREGASVNFKALDYLVKNTKLQIVSYSGDWVKVKVLSTGKTGYVNGNYITKPVSSETVKVSNTNVSNTTSTASTAVTKFVTSSDGLNLRSSASASSTKLANIPYGTQVSVTSTSNGWGKVTYNSKTGYINLSYTSNSKPAANTPVASNGTLKGKIIVLDPGHGGKFAGAQGIVHEEDVNLAIALKTRTFLQNMGAVVIMTRVTDTSCLDGTYNADLVCRPNVATKAKASAFISIHANAGTSSANGSETYYYNSSRGDKKLATAILNEIGEEVGTKLRNVGYGNFSVLRNSTVPSTLIETGFVTNPSDAAKLGSSAYQDKFAKAIAEGIQSYFK